MKAVNIDAKKKFLIIGGIAVAVILLAVVIFVVMTSKSTDSQKEITDAIDVAWDNVKSDEQPAFLSEIDRLSSYQVQSVERENGNYIVKVLVNAPNIDEQLSSLGQAEIQKQNDPEKFDRFLMGQIAKAKIVQTEHEIYVSHGENGYKVTFSDGFVDAMSGGIYSYSQRVLIDMLDQQEGEG